MVGPLAPGWVDVDEFGRLAGLLLMGALPRLNPVETLAGLRQALRLYRGELAGCAPWLGRTARSACAGVWAGCDGRHPRFSLQ